MFVHRKCESESKEGAANRVDTRFGVVMLEEGHNPRWRTCYRTETLPTIHLRYSRTTAEGAHRNRPSNGDTWVTIDLGGGGKPQNKVRVVIYKAEGRT